MCEYDLPTSRPSKVIVSDRYTYRHCQTDTTEIIYHAASSVVNNNYDCSHMQNADSSTIERDGSETHIINCV